ncbi:MAG: amidase [Rhodospirillaceae bacterium]|nr:MAG: amidase [Rhodospirillaceae bacterium]
MTDDKAFATLDGLGLADEIAAGRITPLEAVDAAIRIIERHNPVLKAVVMERFDAARAEAKKMAPGGGLFAGVPFLAKDMNVFTADMPTTFSSRFFAEAAPRGDSEIVRRWKQAGLIILGKTSTPEFAADFVTEPSFRGPCRNPWNPDVTPGGSSGGAAAAVASGMVPMAHGTDSGGSIRVPAACCGLVGFKPSRGLTPSGPFYPELAGGLNCDHALTRSVRDTAAMLDITVGPEPGGAYYIPKPAEAYRDAIRRKPPRRRIAYTATAPSGVTAMPEIVALLDRTVEILRRQGHELIPVALPADVDPYDTAAKLWMPPLALEIEERERALGRAAQDEELEALSRYSRQVAGKMTALDYLRARQRAHDITVAMARFSESFDLLLTPTIGTLPPAIGAIDSRSASFDHDAWQEGAYYFAPFTELFNITGQPAISLPLFRTETGMPAGMHLIGKIGQDVELLQLAAALESDVSGEGVSGDGVSGGGADARPALWG